MRNAYAFFGGFVFALIVGVLAGCSSNPMLALDTMNKRMGAFEIAYDEAMEVVKRQNAEGRIPEDKKPVIREAIQKINEARNAAYAAMGQMDRPVFDDNMRVMYASLSVLREIAAGVDRE